MKKITSLLAVFIISLSFAQVNWMTLEQAMNAQKTNPKKILIDFYADWCEPCKLMEKKTYNHIEISKFINENYYAVKFNAESTETINFYGRNFANSDFANGKHKNSLNDFTKYMNVSSVPSTVFLDEKAMPITNINGFLSAKELEPYLKVIAKDDYKKFRSRQEWENAMRKAKSSIKE